MTRRIAAIGANALFTFGTLACGSHGAPLDVGYVDDGGGGFTQSDGATPAGTLDVVVSPSKATLCAGQCVTLAPAAVGGTSPYSYRWDHDLTANGAVNVCPATTTTYAVTATDSSGRAGELATPDETGAARVVVTVTPDCPEVGAPVDAGASSDGGPGLEFTQSTIAPWTGITVGVQQGSAVYWASWTSTGSGTVAGVITPPSGAIQVTYEGELYGAQTSAGSNYYSPTSTFMSATAPTPPPGPGIIEISGGSPDRFTFSEPVTNPLIAIVSLGTSYLGTPVAIEFPGPVTVLSSGPDTFDPTIAGTLTAADGGVSGDEGSGVIEVEGTF